MRKLCLKNKKAEDTVMSFLIKILLALVVLVVIFVFLFWNSIWEYFRNLPGGYKYDNKDRIVEDISKDQSLLVNYYKVAIIQDGKYILFCTGGDCNNLKTTKLYLSGTVTQGIIYTDINWALDKKVGEIINNRVVVNSDLLNGEGVYEKVKNEIPSYYDLKNLDNSIYITGTIYRDKEYVLTDGEKIFGSAFLRTKDENSFSEKINALGNIDVLIVTATYSFGDIATTEIQFERNGNEIKVFATYKNSEGKEESHLLDCNKNGWSWQTKNLNINNVRATLEETLVENCKW